jgi:hypothetical protein
MMPAVFTLARLARLDAQDVTAPHPPAARVPPSPRLRGEGWGEGHSGVQGTAR